MVELKGQDITGLGFDVCGNIRDGIFVRKVLKTGPAFDCGSIKPGALQNATIAQSKRMSFS